MPAPLPLPLRRVVCLRWQRGHDAPPIAAALGLAPRSVRRLLQRLRDRGTQAVRPAYRYRPPPDDIPLTPVQQAALQVRRDHPTWGAPLRRVFLGHQVDPPTLPTARTVQRWLAQHGLAPAPQGRRPRPNPGRAAHPPDVWQMDASEQVRLANGQPVSWLRLADAPTGAVRGTVVFPPGPMEHGRWPAGAGHLAAIVPALGAAPGGADRQRHAVGLDRGLADGVGAVAAGLGRVGLVQSPPATATQRGDRAGARAGQVLGRAAHLPEPGGVATTAGADGPDATGGVPPGGQPSRWAAHAGLAHAGRPYSAAWERAHWDEAKVLEHLGSYAVRRRVRRRGRVSLYNRDYQVGEKHRGEPVGGRFDPVRREWVCPDGQDRQRRRWPAPESCRSRIVKLDVSQRG